MKTVRASVGQRRVADASTDIPYPQIGQRFLPRRHCVLDPVSFTCEKGTQ